MHHSAVNTSIDQRSLATGTPKTFFLLAEVKIILLFILSTNWLQITLLRRLVN